MFCLQRGTRAGHTMYCAQVLLLRDHEAKPRSLFKANQLLWFAALYSEVPNNSIARAKKNSLKTNNSTEQNSTEQSSTEWRNLKYSVIIDTFSYFCLLVFVLLQCWCTYQDIC